MSHLIARPLRKQTIHHYSCDVNFHITCYIATNDSAPVRSDNRHFAYSPKHVLYKTTCCYSILPQVCFLATARFIFHHIPSPHAQVYVKQPYMCIIMINVNVCVPGLLVVPATVTLYSCSHPSAYLAGCGNSIALLSSKCGLYGVRVLGRNLWSKITNCTTGRNACELLNKPQQV